MAIACLLQTLAIAQLSNKPNTATKVSEPTKTVATTPGAYGTIPATELKLNYIRTRSAVAPITDTATFDAADYKQVKEITQYIDGLGRPIQTVARQITPGSAPQDMVSPVVYDQYGREQYQYLPYIQTSGISTNDGKFKINPFGDQKIFYSSVYPVQQPGYEGEQVFYNQTQFEQSPLNRVTKNLAVGNSWAGSDKGIGMQYLINTAADDVKMWNIGYDSSLSCSITTTSDVSSINIPIVASAPYAAGTLYKNITTDENGNQVIEYKDKEGHLILKKVQNDNDVSAKPAHAGWLCTYYIYDDFGLLRFVIPPKAVAALMQTGIDWKISTTICNELCFRYEYDDQQRMIAKKVPGAAWTLMVYDKRDRLVYTQDGNMRSKNQWATSLYDLLNRLVTTGVITYSGTHCQLQDYTNNHFESSTNYTVTVTGPLLNDLYVNKRIVDITQYKAAKNVYLMDEFTSEVGAEFTIDIDSSTNATSEDVQYANTTLPPGNNFIALTISYYDIYTWNTTQPYNTTYLNKPDASSNLYAETTPTTPNVLVKGLITGSKVRTLPNPNDLSKGQWLTTVLYYDEKNRIIQTQTDNIKGGNDISLILYDFSGKSLSNYTVHQYNGASTSIGIKTNIEYDHAGRVLTTIQSLYINVTDATAKTSRMISKNEYDIMGQLKNKSVGQKRASDGSLSTDPLETLAYNYNIRGWLKSINKDYALSSTGNNNWFGMDLSYDWGYNNNQLNGNIAGIKWRSKGGAEQRSYGFAYDNTNRLLFADFAQGASYTDDPTVNYDMRMGTGLNDNSAYDENGNIKSMTQYGLKLTSSPIIDKLNYNYTANTNKLLNVIDDANDPKTILGDFRTSSKHPSAGSKTATTVDYNYDVNGNMVKDYNKDIVDDIVYNHLNLPYQIKVKDKGTITYLYDATGNKLEKKVEELTGGKVTVTDYVGATQYVNDTLQFINHTEGRLRPLLSGDWAFDYFLKDHLGNVRTVLTDEWQQDMYPMATMETANAVIENAFYSNIDATRAPRPSGFVDVTTSPNNYVAKLKGDEKKIGPGIILKVMAGDKISMKVNSWYDAGGASPAGNNSIINDVISILTNQIPSASGGKIGSGNINATMLQNPITAFSDIVGNSTNTIPIKPKAHLCWMLLKESQLTSVAEASGCKQVGEDKTVTTLNGTVDVPVNGYLYIYTSNETQNIPVFFDNLQVSDVRGPLLSEDHYYPFGLTMVGISSKAAGKIENKRKFNEGTELESKEFFDGSGLELYSTTFRSYDPQIGRFHQTDPWADLTSEHSQYAYVDNNPVLFNDPSGLTKGFPNDPRPDDESLPNVVVTPNSNRYQYVNYPSYMGGGRMVDKHFEGNAYKLESRMATGAPLIKPTDRQSYMEGLEDGSLADHLERKHMAQEEEEMLYEMFFTALTGPSDVAAIGGAISKAPQLLKIFRVAEIGEVAAKMEATGSYYSVAYEMKLAATSYPGVYRGAHFLEANKALSATIATDTRFASTMSELGITIPKSSAGSILGKSPANWVWHHDVSTGVMQLVPKAQHTIGSLFWNTLHPSGVGGFSIWGK